MSGVVVWICGLPSSGKSTLAVRVRELLRERRVPACLLDGDEARREVFPSLGYGEHDREAFYAGLASLAALLARDDLIVIVAATAHRRLFRERARAKAPRFLEVFVDADAEECRARDAKGLYAASRDTMKGSLPGVHVAFEPPHAPDIVARGGHDEAAAAAIVRSATS